MRIFAFFSAFLMVILCSSVVHAETETNDLIAAITQLRWQEWRTPLSARPHFVFDIPQGWESHSQPGSYWFTPGAMPGDVGCLVIAQGAASIPQSEEEAVQAAGKLVTDWQEIARESLKLAGGQAASLIKGEGYFENGERAYIYILHTTLNGEHFTAIAGAQKRFFFPFEPALRHILTSIRME